MTPSATKLQDAGLQAPAKRLWPRRIGRRLALGFGVLVLLMLLLLTQIGWQLGMAGEVVQRFATGDMQRLLRVQALSLQIESAGNALVLLINAPRQNRVTQYADVDARNRRIDGIVDSLVLDLRDTEQEETLRRLAASRRAYEEAFLATVDEVEAEDPVAAARALNEKVNPALKGMLGESNQLLQRERERIESRLDEVQQMFRRTTLAVGLLSLLLMTLAAWLALRTTKSVVLPLAVLERAARHIASGDYSQRTPATGTTEVDRVGSALNTMADAVRQREQQIERIAYADGLTGLPNRAGLLKLADSPMGDNNCLLMLDIARLKVINESLGYTTGDSLIKEFSKRATAVLAAALAAGQMAPGAVLARLSGGTFAVWFCVGARAQAERLRQQLEASLATPVQCGAHSVDISVACGQADQGLQDGGLPVGTLLRNAEVALHNAKRNAVGHVWHSETQEAARLDHLSLVSDLRNAVADSQLQMWLQPKFSLQTGQAVGSEALVRWQHPLRGFVSPAAFIPFAEQTGYITLVTEWMLRQALATLQQWQHSHKALGIAVNVSTRDLQNPGFARKVETLLGEYGVSPAKLRLEITESGLMEDAQKSIALLHALREIGTPLSIDDFGTGYSSLAYLQKLPVDELKIDRAFVEGIDSAAATQKLVKAMIEMGHGLGLVVTAEGIETQAERDTLAHLGADVMQGYFGSKPLHGEALQRWLDAH